MNHPDREQLLAFLREQATGDIVAHVEACEVCQGDLERLERVDEAAQRELQQAATLAPVPGEEVERALASLAGQAGVVGEVPSTVEHVLLRLGSFELLSQLGPPGGQG